MKTGANTESQEATAESANETAETITTTEANTATPTATAVSAEPDLSELKRKHYDAIRGLNEKCVDAGIEYEDKKADAAAAKRRHEWLQAQLNQLIAQGANPQKELAFPEEQPVDAEAWKDVPISDVIELTDKQFEKLEAAGVRTVGQFEQLRSGQVDGYPDGLRSIKGVGQKTVDAWEDQIVEWLAANAREVDAAETTEGAATT